MTNEFSAPFNGGSTILTVANIKPSQFIIGNLVTIDLGSGALKFHEGYTPEAAAEIFWSAMASEYVRYLEWKRSNPSNT